MGDGAILEVEGLDAAYGQAQILFDVSLALARGEIVALMGRNGAGKSTTLKAIMGLVPAARARCALPAATSAACRAIASPGWASATCRRIGASSPISPSTRTSRSAPRPAAGGGPRARWTPERLFSIFPNLAEMRGRRASQMSGGEQQMLTIARTLMGNPEAVLLDEPSEGPGAGDRRADGGGACAHEGRGHRRAAVRAEPDFASAWPTAPTSSRRAPSATKGPMAAIAGDAALREAHLGL